MSSSKWGSVTWWGALGAVIREMTSRLRSDIGKRLGVCVPPSGRSFQFGTARLVFAALIGAMLLTGCAADLGTTPHVPAALVDRAAIDNLPNVRYWGDSKPGSYADLARQRVEIVRKSLGPNGHKTKRVINILTVSGGGSDGAFGAGLLVGWTHHGTRPQFDFVTGISTGAMMAPLAFLGPRYDRKLKEAYTTLNTEDVATPQVLSAIIGVSSSLASTKPLEEMIAKYMTADILAEIGREHVKGRILMIGTTNLEAQRSVIWDIGAIAVSGHPRALELVRKIILASAAIPGAFPPVEIDVTIEGKRYQEMHVDGGVTRQVFLYPPGFTPQEIDKGIGWNVSRRLFILCNAKLSPEFRHIKKQLLPIASRSISTLIKTQGIGDLYEIHTLAKRDRADYNLAYIPEEFALQSKDAFDKAYMNELFKLGYELGRRGYPWSKLPPGLGP